MKSILIGLLSLTSLISFTQFNTEQVIIHDYVTDLKVIDLDNDGDQDIIYASGDTIKLLTNSGTGTFTKSNAHVYSLGTYLLDVIDLDNDGLKDVLFTTYLDNKVRFLKNLGGGSFSLTSVNIINDLEFSRLENLEVAKRNDSSYILISSNYDLKTRIYRSDTINNFDKYPSSFAYSDASFTHSFGYINSDSIIDVLGNQKRLYVGKSGASFFNAPTPLTSLPQTFIYTKLADVDNDSDLDYLYISTNNKLGYHEYAKPQDTFATLSVVIDSTDLSAIEIGFNASSNFPFIAAIDNQTDKVSYFNNSNGIFTTENLITDTFLRPTLLDVGDLDQDNNDDIIVYSGSGNTRISWFKNLGPTTEISENKTVNTFKLFPNPANDIITISSHLTEFNLTIVNTNGKTLLNLENITEKEINIEHFAKEVYFVLISSSKNNEVSYQKLVKY